jgi:predicted PurR-regulated permease PerM
MSDAISKSITYVQRNTMEVIRLGRSIIAVVSRAIFVFFMTLMLGAYIMITRERIVGFFRSLVFPDARRSFDLLLARVDRGLSGVVRGQLLICLVNGILSAIGFWLFDLKYWPILAIVAALMSVVPIFGSILSSVPIVAVALTQSLGTALEVLLWIVGIHQIEANFLNPKIIGDQAKIHPVLVIFSLLVGEHFFGVTGALLAVPVFSIAQSLFLHFRYITFGDDAPADSFLPPPPKYSTPSPPQVTESSASG